MKHYEKPRPLNRLLSRLLWQRLFFPALILAVGLALFATYSKAVSIHNELQQINESISNRVQDFLFNAYQILDSVGEISEFEDLVDLQRDITTLQRTNPFFDTIYTLDAVGKINAVAPFDTTYLNLDMSQQEYYKNRTASPDRTLSKPFISPKTGTLTVYLVKNMPNGMLMVGELSLIKLQQVVNDEVTLSRSQIAFISNNKGTLLAHPDFSLVTQQANLAFIRPWSDQTDSYQLRLVRHSNHLYFENQLKIPNTDWIITAEYPFVAAYSSFLFSIALAALLFVLIWAAMMLNLNQETSRKIVAPIARLSEKAHALAFSNITDLSPTISRVPPSFIEVQDLASNFEHMYQTIQDRQRAIQESETKYRRLIELSNDALYVEYQNHLVIINDKFTEIFGITAETLLQSPTSFFEFVSENSRLTLLERQSAVLHGEHTNPQLEFSAIDKNGHEILFEASLAQYPYLGGVAIQSILRDITDRKRTEQAEREQRILAEALRDTSAALNSTIDFEVLVNRILTNVDRVVPHTSSTLMLIDKDGQTVRIVAEKGYEKYNIQNWVKTVTYNLHKTPNLKYMYETGKPIVISDTRTTPGWISMPEIEWLVSYASAPIRVKGNIIGFLNLDSSEVNFFSQQHADRLLDFSDQVGIAINNAQLLRDLQTSHHELVTAYDTTLLGWSKALELRDYETQGHSQRVTDMTLRLAQRLPFTAQELTNIRYGSLLHDIGKIGIPDSILFKRGPLTESEWRTMRLHPIYAQQVLAHVPYLANAVDIPYYHHEHWDGSGYPHGLTGEQIPLAARIFTLVDVWDSLRSHRPYHTPWPKGKVIEYMQSQAGKLFDPHVVDIFIDMILEEKEEEETE